MIMEKKPATLCKALLLSFIVWGFTIVSAQPVLFMSPADQQVDVNSEFDVVIEIRDVQSTPASATMRSYSITVGFDPTLLEALSITRGSFLSDFGSLPNNYGTQTPQPILDNTAGSVLVEEIINGQGEMASGSGVLFTIRFKALQNGTVDLAFDSHDLRNPDNGPLAHSIEEAQVFSGVAHVYVDPDQTILSTTGEQFTVDIKIRNAYNIGGAVMIINYDPGVIEVVSTAYGSFMTSLGYATNRFIQVREAEAEIEYNEAIYSPPDASVKGAGTFFSITFEAISNGTSPIAFKTTGGQYDITRLRTPDNQPLQYTWEDGSVEIGPIAIELCAFTATPQENGVLLEWTTASETQTAGFFVQGKSESSEFQRLHSDMIFARGTASCGADYHFTDDRPADPNTVYRLEDIGYDGSSTFHGPIAIQTTNVEHRALPQDTQLLGNYPNPFNPSTTIRYHLSAQSHVRLTVLDAQGQVVRTLVDGMNSAGVHERVWNGTNENGDRVASGLYFYTLNTETEHVRQKMLLIK